MRIFAGVPLGAGVKRHWGLSTTSIFGDLGGYTSSKSSEIWQAVLYDICYHLSTGNWLQNEWPWVAISWQNAFSASNSWIRAFEWQK